MVFSTFRNIFFTALAILIPSLFVLILGLVLVTIFGVPFIEGDSTIETGEAYEFKIDMSKSDAFKIVQKHYSKDEHILRISWLIESKLGEDLKRFEDPHLKYHAQFGRYEVPIQNLDAMTLPLVLGPSWNIELPSIYQNTITLKFSNETLVEIRKRRWLFERP